jgi:hypothetical protein
MRTVIFLADELVKDFPWLQAGARDRGRRGLFSVFLFAMLAASQARLSNERKAPGSWPRVGQRAPQNRPCSDLARGWRKGSRRCLGMADG